ncbi:GGDEF domain-containing protein [Xylophilus sp. ASV27]|uniref:GGDEF domain-containing protein n=1 Tax=Xylophilus sp. ASV27 TaxID=2795129 RepID=UPI0018ED8179|nr:GGDEF domain-containing protein [Xylophilus sp. ASV27]
MTPILQHLIEITGHRDHDRLELSVISALRHLVEVRRVRKLEFASSARGAVLRGYMLFDGGEMPPTQPAPVVDESLADYPELVDAIEHRHSSAQRYRPGQPYTLWLPVRLHDKVVSCLEVQNDTPYEQQTLEVVYGIVEVYRNYQSLLDDSERDALTGLFNRKTFDEQFSRRAREQAQFPAKAGDAGAGDSDQQWLAVVDIDHFKQVNDRFGHIYGDEVLILVANLLRSSFRAQDRIFRFGGEEFVVLLRSVSLESAHRIFNRFRINIEQHNFPQVGRVTVSVGFTGAQTGAPVEILGHADQALYFAKEHGRNQVCFYEDLVAQGLLQSAGVAHDSVELF